MNLVRYLGEGIKGKHWFFVNKYHVCLSSSERSCDCMWGTMQESRGEKSFCKHTKAAATILEVVTNGKIRSYKDN